ncbi:hypothetical protein U1Q18_003942 [Sarracenia purpurea var. burkii]
MEIEVIMPSPAVDFNFDSACTSPYVSAPSSPHRFGNFFFSAPTSPTGAGASSPFLEFNTYSDGDAATSSGSVPSKIPFSWEEKPGIPKTKNTDVDSDFEFDFSGQLERTSLSADELFDGGKIKPLKPPPRLQFTERGLADSPKSPRSPIKTNIFKEALSPRHKKNDFDPFEAAIEQTRRENYNNQERGNEQKQQQERGRERIYNSSASNLRQKKGTRSLSPFRVRDISESEINCQSSNSTTSTKPKNPSSSSPSPFSNSAWKGYKKWKLSDFLLFRSASEGRATTGKDPLKKYSLFKQSSEDVKNSSFRSTDSAGSVSRRRGPVSPHELHYTANRAVSEEMRRKTFLPYKHGLLGCLGFNPAVHELSRGLGLSRG